MLDNQMTILVKPARQFWIKRITWKSKTKGLCKYQSSTCPSSSSSPKENNILTVMHYLTTKYGWEPEFASGSDKLLWKPEILSQRSRCC